MTLRELEQQPQRTAIVWIVEDSATAAERARAALSSRFAVEVFEDGHKTMERITAGTLPDVILLDWHLPGLSGLEVCRLLRERHNEVTLPILMITGQGPGFDASVALDAGANDFLTKPYDDVELVARIASLHRTKRIAESLRAQEVWSTTALNSIGEAVISTDERGRIDFINAAAQALTGFDQASARGRPVAEVFRSSRDATDGQPAILLRADGSSATLDDCATPIRHAGRELGKVVVFRDIVSRSGAARPPNLDLFNGRSPGGARPRNDSPVPERVDRARLKEQERGELEQHLIGIVSHDLRNPIAAITMSAALLLRKESLDDRARLPLTRIVSSAERANRMIRDLLDFTRVRFGEGLPVSREALDLHALARQTADELRAAHPDREIQLDLEGDGRGEWDGDRLEQLIGNLLSNALQYSPPESHVRVSTRDEGHGVVIEVHNEGPAIPDETMTRIFQPLQRGTPATSSKRNVGLGLFIAKHVAEAHGGTITVTSSDLGGTSFFVHLPRRAGSSAP